jgi:MYND finger
VEDGSAPDLTRTETAFKFGYATLVVAGAQRIQSDPSPLQHAETLKYLLSRGCPPDIEDIAGHTALSHVTMGSVSLPELARLLLEVGADVNHRDRYGCPPIMNAFQTNQIATIDILMEFEADLDVADADGTIPRSFFVSCGPQVAHVVNKWQRRRAGEEAPMADKVCDNCRRQEVNLKMCARCHSARYCGSICQRVSSNFFRVLFFSNFPLSKAHTGQHTSNFVALSPCRIPLF